MAPDRQSIEHQDFPVVSRGYDPEAVDAHLSAIAEEVGELERSARRRTDTLASSASDQVRLIVEAAERSAAEIQRDAETDAREIRDQASREAQATREQATAEAREHVGAMSKSTDTIRTRLDSVRSELDALIESLRAGSDRLSAELRLLEGNLAEPGSVAEPPTAGEDAEGARLVALNMALDGTPREDTARYLNENFSLADASGLLDEVYASVES